MTRLFYENMLTDEFPSIQWLRVCTSAPFTVTIYACDANLDLSENLTADVKHFLSTNGMASCVHIVKHYFELRKDEAFPIGQIPDIVKEAALLGDVTSKGVSEALKKAFPFIDPSHLIVNKDTVTFRLAVDEKWTPHQLVFVEMMLQEILPVGSSAVLA